MIGPGVPNGSLIAIKLQIAAWDPAMKNPDVGHCYDIPEGSIITYLGPSNNRFYPDLILYDNKVMMTTLLYYKTIYDILS